MEAVYGVGRHTPEHPEAMEKERDTERFSESGAHSFPKLGQKLHDCG